MFSNKKRTNLFTKIKKQIGKIKIVIIYSPYEITENMAIHKHLKRKLNLLLTNIFEGIATSNEKIIIKKNCKYDNSDIPGFSFFIASLFFNN